MFETATFSYGPSPKRVWTTAMGFTGQAVLIGCALLAPLVSPQTLGRASLVVTTLVTPGAPPAPAPPDTRVVPVPHHAAGASASTHVFTAPGSVPTMVPKPGDDPPEFTGNDIAVPGSVPGGIGVGGPGGNSILTQVMGEVPVVRPPVVERPPVTVATAPVKPPRVSVVRLGTPIYRVEPIYPSIAKQVRVSGVVELLGVLGTDGRIHELKVLRGHPLLIGAAVDAVRQWIYAPTLLNGQAVEVSAPITVNFILKQ